MFIYWLLEFTCCFDTEAYLPIMKNSCLRNTHMRMHTVFSTKITFVQETKMNFESDCYMRLFEYQTLYVLVIFR